MIWKIKDLIIIFANCEKKHPIIYSVLSANTGAWVALGIAFESRSELKKHVRAVNEAS